MACCWFGGINLGFAQITFDANAVATNTNGTNNGNTVSVTVPAGNNRLLVALIGTDDLNATPTVTFNGSTLVAAGTAVDNFSTAYDAKVHVYYAVLGNGGAITQNISVSGLSDYYLVGGMSFQGIDQTTPVKQMGQAGAPTGNGNSSKISASISNVVAGNLLFSFFGEDNARQFNWGGNYINGNNQTNTNMNGDGYYFATYNANANAGNHTFTYDIENGKQSCAGVLIEFAQATSIPEVTISVNPAMVTEDGTTNLDYTFTSSVAIATDLPINFTLSGTAEDDDDFTVSTPGNNNETISYTTKVGAGNNTGTITLKANQTKAVLRINPTSDATAESDETVTVTINN